MKNLNKIFLVMVIFALFAMQTKAVETKEKNKFGGIICFIKKLFSGSDKSNTTQTPIYLNTTNEDFEDFPSKPRNFDEEQNFEKEINEESSKPKSFSDHNSVNRTFSEVNSKPRTFNERQSRKRTFNYSKFKSLNNRDKSKTFDERDARKNNFNTYYSKLRSFNDHNSVTRTFSDVNSRPRTFNEIQSRQRYFNEASSRPRIFNDHLIMKRQIQKPKNNTRSPFLEKNMKKEIPDFKQRGFNAYRERYFDLTNHFLFKREIQRTPDVGDGIRAILARIWEARPKNKGTTSRTIEEILEQSDRNLENFKKMRKEEQKSKQTNIQY